MTFNVSPSLSKPFSVIVLNIFYKKMTKYCGNQKFSSLLHRFKKFDRHYASMTILMLLNLYCPFSPLAAAVSAERAPLSIFFRISFSSTSDTKKCNTMPNPNIRMMASISKEIVFVAYRM